jgi:lipoprotein NlpI
MSFDVTTTAKPSALFAFRLALILAALLGFRVASWSESSEDPKDCESAAKANRSDAAIALCTGAVLPNRSSDQDLASSYNERGLAYYVKRDYDRAINEFDRAIALQPTLASALARRADAYQAKRQYERALADFDAAARLESSIAFERAKGFLLFYLGRMSQSVEAFEHYLKPGTVDVQASLFRYLAEAKIANVQSAALGLQADAAKLKTRAWPALIIDFHLGKIDEPTMFGAANDPDLHIKAEKVCAANFHAAEQRLFRAYLSGAITLLRAAAKDCPAQLHESHAASAELERLGQK